MQDNEMIQRIRQGDKALFGQLADRYYDDVFRYCYYQTGNEQAAWDCTQDTFFHLLRFLDSYTEQGKFKAWLLRIALNACRDYFRKNRPNNYSYEELSEQHREAASILESAASPARASESSLCHSSPENRVETALLIQEGLNRLPETQQETVVLYFYYGYKQREIARITGAPLSTVKTRLRTGIQSLRHFYEDLRLL